MVDPFRIPVYLNVRDRLTDLARLVSWLEEAGHQELVLLDNDSAYPPLLEYLEQTPHTVIRLRANCGSKSLWVADMVPRGEFVFTDPDILPIDECPKDAICYLQELMALHPFPKAGLGLYLDDVPRTLQSYNHELSLVTRRRELRKGVYDSQIDTTFALYRARTPSTWDRTMRAIRCTFPYQARHMPWYHIDEPTEEERFYLNRDTIIRGPSGSSWAAGNQ